MLYDNLGRERMNDYNQAVPHYITLNNFYINNNQILSSTAKKNRTTDYYGSNNYNYNNDLNYKYNSPEHINNFLNQKRGVNKMNPNLRRVFLSPPSIQSTQNFKNILSKSEIIPFDDINAKKINSGKNLINIIFENKDGPKDSIRIYKSIEAIRRPPDIAENSLNNNNFKEENFNFRKNENNDFINHPIDNNRNYLTKSIYINDINELEKKPQDNLRNYFELNIFERFSQQNEKDINKNNNNKESQLNPIHNIKDESNIFKSKEKEKENVHSNWDKIMKKFDKSEDKKSINKNALSKDRNRYNDEDKYNKSNIIYNNIRKVNLISLNNNNIQNKINLNSIKDKIKEEIIKKDNINEEKNNKDNDIKDDKIKNDIKINNKEINESIMKDKKELNDNISKNEEKIGIIKNNIINEENTGKIINDIIGKNQIEIINENIGNEKNIRNIKEEKMKSNNQIRIKNDNKNKELENEIKENNEFGNKEIISNIDINYNLNLNKENSDKKENKTQKDDLYNNIAQKDDMKGRNIIEDIKEKINENEIKLSEDNLKNSVLNEEKAEDNIQNNIQKIDKNENLKIIDNKDRNNIILQNDIIIEDKDNINQINASIVPHKENKKDNLKRNIIYDIKKEIIAKEEIKIHRSSSFKNLKKTNIDNLNAIEAFKDNIKDANPKQHKQYESMVFKSMNEHDFNNLKQTYQNPLEDSLEKSEIVLNPQNYKYLGVMGEGEYGKIYLTQSIKDNQYYAMKIETFKNRGDAHKSQMITKLVKDLLKKTKSEGICKIYGDIWLKKNNIYYYYVLMEKAERDMEQELVIRGNYVQFYSEIDLTNVLCQLILTCSELQKNNIAHRDIKPQNILILSGRYKLCDFGEAISFNKNGVVIQKIRGTELYMSPILFFGLKKNFAKVKHNAYKSDVFSLGLCILLAGTLNYDSICQIRELTDMEEIKNIIMYYLSSRYSTSFILFLLKMLEVDENKRPDFIQLENLLVKK